MTWSKLMCKHEKKIKKAMQAANWDALRNKHMRFVVYLYDDGSIYTMQDVAGGNSFIRAAWEGRAIHICGYCHQYEDGNPSLAQACYKKEFLDEDFDRRLEELVYNENLANEF